jgi:hypothetical protein
LTGFWRSGIKSGKKPSVFFLSKIPHGIAAKITITGISGGITTALLDVIDSDGNYIGEGVGSISGNSVTYSVNIRGSLSSWNGRGPHYLHIDLNIWSGSGWYDYTDGTGSDQTYNISSASSAIPFSKFTAQGEMNE